MASRLQVVLAGVVLLASAGSVACRKDKAPEAAPEQSATAQPEAIRQSIRELEPGIKALEGKFAGLRQQFNPLSPSLPGIGDVRAKFYGSDEVVGRMGVKLNWLSGRLDEAVKAGKADEIAEIAKQVNDTHAEIRELDRIALELIHEVAPFQRLMRDFEAARAEVLAAASASSAPSTSPTGASNAAPKPATPKSSSAPKPTNTATPATPKPSAP
jgi:hypothetical protein